MEDAIRIRITREPTQRQAVSEPSMYEGAIGIHYDEGLLDDVELVP